MQCMQIFQGSNLVSAEEHDFYLLKETVLIWQACYVCPTAKLFLAKIKMPKSMKFTQ